MNSEDEDDNENDDEKTDDDEKIDDEKTDDDKIDKDDTNDKDENDKENDKKDTPKKILHQLYAIDKKYNHRNHKYDDEDDKTDDDDEFDREQIETLRKGINEEIEFQIHFLSNFIEEHKKCESIEFIQLCEDKIRDIQIVIDAITYINLNIRKYEQYFEFYIDKMEDKDRVFSSVINTYKKYPIDIFPIDTVFNINDPMDKNTIYLIRLINSINKVPYCPSLSSSSLSLILPPNKRQKTQNHYTVANYYTQLIQSKLLELSS